MVIVVPMALYTSDPVTFEGYSQNQWRKKSQILESDVLFSFESAVVDCFVMIFSFSLVFPLGPPGVTGQCRGLY